MGLKLTDHATTRMSQRGVEASALEAVMQLADREIFAGRGCVALSISRSLMLKMAENGEISPGMVERLSNLVVVVANDNSAIVTVVKPCNRKSARVYRKPKGYPPRSATRRRR
jgi:hypothetical protein